MNTTFNVHPPRDYSALAQIKRKEKKKPPPRRPGYRKHNRDMALAHLHYSAHPSLQNYMRASVSACWEVPVTGDWEAIDSDTDSTAAMVGGKS
jgi:hypothetical protein